MIFEVELKLSTYHCYNFQDKENLYFVMEYVPGGDLMSKLIKDEKFSEDLARYVTQSINCFDVDEHQSSL